MTTRSIHQYVLGTLAKLGLDEKNCSKFQTGGPDGDLGSNEIKISEDKTVGIVDGTYLPDFRLYAVFFFIHLGILHLLIQAVEFCMIPMVWIVPNCADWPELE
jgi:hypothetical protein